MSKMKQLVVSSSELARSVEPFTVLLLRVSLGALFATTGYGKLTHLERTVGFFQELGIPAPELQAVFVGALELAGGVAIVLGLLTRVFAVSLAITMAVAIGTALWPDVETLLDLLTLDETLYLLILSWLAAAGPGPLSADRWLVARLPLFRPAGPDGWAPSASVGSARV